MTTFLALLFSLASFASDKDIFDKTYPRDNSFCQVGKKRIELMVRGFQSQTEPKERMWGEHVFIRTLNGAPKKLSVTTESGLYRFFQGNPSSCTKTVGTLLDGKFVVLFQKLNSPHKHQLVIKYIDPKTMNPLDTVHTAYRSDKAMVVSDGVVFRTHPPARQEIEMGKVVINGDKYLYQDHIFPVWVKLDKSGFNTESFVTYDNFAYKNFFKSVEDFHALSGWQEMSKVFTKTHLYVAINHAKKSKCILFTDSKTNLTGEESWVCQ